MIKKLLGGIISVALIVVVLTCLDDIFNFVNYLIKLDNKDFGFPLWLDIVISTIGGIIAYCFVGGIAGFINFYDKSTMSLGKNIFGIIFGFLIGFLIHVFLKYWYVILSILVLLLVIIILIFIRNKKVEGKK